MPIDADLVRALKRVAARIEKDHAERDELVRQAAADGGGLREIGRLVGLTHTTIRRILDREDI